MWASLTAGACCRLAWVCVIACRVLTLEGPLFTLHGQIENTWSELDLRILTYKDSRDTFILGAVDDVTVALDESLVSVNMILGSRFVGPIREPVDGVYKRLLAMQVRVVLLEAGKARIEPYTLCLCSVAVYRCVVGCTPLYFATPVARPPPPFAGVPGAVDRSAAQVDRSGAHLHRPRHHASATWGDQGLPGSGRGVAGRHATVWPLTLLKNLGFS
jgi:hypothetical protein